MNAYYIAVSITYVTNLLQPRRTSLGVIHADSAEAAINEAWAKLSLDPVLAGAMSVSLEVEGA